MHMSFAVLQVQERHNDPLVYHHGIKARWTMATINAQHLIQRRVPEIQIPFLTLHGTADLVVNISSSYFLMEHTKSEDKMIKVVIALLDVMTLQVCCTHNMPLNTLKQLLHG